MELTGGVMNRSFQSLSIFTVVVSTVIGLGFTARATSITIENSLGQPLADASVLIGDTDQKPFANNQLLTNAQGTFTIPPQWQTAEPMTIEANGYITTTFLNVEPTASVYQLNAVDSTTDLPINGQTTGFQNPGQDGKMDFALVYPALTRRQLAQFDVNAVISPNFVKLPVLFASVSVPSNLTLPDQTQNYYLPIEFNKPDYAMYVHAPGQYKMVGIHGRFPFSQVVDALRGGKSFYDVLNRFQFLEGGKINANVTSAGADQQDIAINQMTFDNHVTVQAPQVAAGMAMVSLPMVKEGNVYYATDLKELNSKTSQSLAIPSQANAHNILSLLMPKKKKLAASMTDEVAMHPELSLQLIIDNLLLSVKPISHVAPFLADTPSGQSVAFQSSQNKLAQFLPLVSPPVVNSDGSLTLAPPATTAGIAPVATYVVFSRLDPINAGKYKLMRRFRLFEAYSQGWVSTVNFPHVIDPLKSGQTYRWEVFFLGRDNSAPTAGYFLDTITHVSRNQYDFTE